VVAQQLLFILGEHLAHQVPVHLAEPAVHPHLLQLALMCTEMLHTHTRTTTLGSTHSLGHLVVYKKLKTTVGAYPNSRGFMETMLRNLSINMETSLA